MSFCNGNFESKEIGGRIMENEDDFVLKEDREKSKWRK